MTIQDNQSLESVFIAPPENKKWQVKSARKAMEKESASLASLLSGSGEKCLLVAHDMDMYSHLVVVTDRRTFQFKRGRVQKELAHSDVAATSLKAHPNDYILVIIESYSSRLDYSPQDSMRFTKILMPHVATPRIGQAICSVIDQLAGLT